MIEREELVSLLLKSVRCRLALWDAISAIERACLDDEDRELSVDAFIQDAAITAPLNGEISAATYPSLVDSFVYRFDILFDEPVATMERA